MKPVIIETSNRFVAFGYTSDTSGTTVRLTRAKCAIYWGTTGGVGQLAAECPQSQSRICTEAPGEVVIHEVIRVWDVSPEAEKKWTS